VLYRVELPGDDGGATVRDFIAGWVGHPALRRIVEADGGTWPSGALDDQVEALHEFSRRWDFRGGAERLDMGSGRLQIDARRLFADAAELGLTAAQTPSQSKYDHGLVLGGTALASIYRLRRLYQLREDGIEVDNVAVLTALREVGEPELELVRTRREIAHIVNGATTEFDVMTAATEAYSHSSARIEHKAHANPHLAAARAQVGNAIVLAAPSGDPGRRANTRDNYDVYSREVGPTDSVLIVTSSIYLPYQFFIALQALGWDQPRAIEAVGFPPEWMDGVLVGPSNVLQELRSALFGARNTLHALAHEAAGR
jgi:hypothetical protein